MADKGSIDLMGGGFTRGMLAEMEQKMLLQVFSKYIVSVEGKINDGKEATVYLCVARKPADGHVAAKVYRDRRFRAFANNAQYTDPGKIRDKRLSKAVRKGTRVGRRVSQQMWVDREWQALKLLHQAGVSVPEPLDHSADAVLMEFIGSEGRAAPMLSQTRLTPGEAESAWRAVLRDVECLLAEGLIHGDLSAYNVLYQNNRPRLIDLPQAVSVDDAVDGWTMFHRDVSNIAGYFQRQGLDVDPMAEAVRLWSLYAV